MKAVERSDLTEYERASQCNQMNFLKKFVDWLNWWKDLQVDLHVGGLTKDTFEAAISSTGGIIQLIVESFFTTNIERFLCGNIQTNDLEIRFGRYRGLSGYNYHVSVRQIMEAEKKLRIKNIISSLPGELKISKYSAKREVHVDVTPFLDVFDSNYIENFNDYDHSSFMYVSGYAGHTLIQKLDCKFCRELIIKSVGHESHSEYFDFLQKGGLIVPTENCIFLLLHMNAIFTELRKDVHKRRLFQFSNCPRSVLVLLTLEGVSRSPDFVVDLNDTCVCDRSYKDIFTPLLSIYANITLNNYRKKINDMALQRKQYKLIERKRKAETNKENDCSQAKLSKPNRKTEIYKKL